MTFVSQQQVRFAHVDAAGIVFYPRYFEMLNAAVEDYFAAVVGIDFAEMHLRRGLGVPTVKLESEFTAPSRLGDLLDFELEVVRVGRSSLELAIAVRCGVEPRFRVQVVLVCMQLDGGRAVAWPADMRPRVQAEAA
ncbi:acyl-CoA thioesterase [Sphingomonas nostoxanthinifaciens]|uniref:acyl-CoA thioesterase n=1 Tax=Sphingomonas nostoxanthinifaciens TaxID=2872652 RepID=UPI001CC1FCC8|nr:thioesterase family protein [Sphingomonas nostoxanthinifaciens]UAK22902.1 acyl-CoA thioesterase [Sphingomonas nostoxanthinifaciens]